MKQIDQKDFESLVKDFVDGKITKQELTEKLETTVKTLNYKISELANTNPGLYRSFIKKIPYVPRNIHIDIEALAIAVIRYGREETSEKLGISIRTISRKVKELKHINPGLYELYRTRHKKRTEKQREEFELLLDSFDTGVIPKRSGLLERQKEIEETLKKFNELIEKGISYKEAAKRLGYASNSSMWCMQQDLAKIQLAIQMEGGGQEVRTEEEMYRESLKVDGVETTVRKTKGNDIPKKVIDREI